MGDFLKGAMTIGADGIDVSKVMDEIYADVRQRKESGQYEHFDFLKTDQYRLDQIKDEDELLYYYFRFLTLSAEIDINDFEIKRKPGLLGSLEVVLKKIIWKFLKFYTYRLFSQQNNYNASIVSTLKSLNRKINTRVEELEKRIEQLEKRQSKPS